MGLIGGISRTAVVAGTASAVSNRISRRQANRWAEKDQQVPEALAYEQAQAYAQQAYAPPFSPPQRTVSTADDLISQLLILRELKAAEVLTEEEFEEAGKKLAASVPEGEFRGEASKQLAASVPEGEFDDASKKSAGSWSRHDGSNRLDLVGLATLGAFIGLVLADTFGSATPMLYFGVAFVTIWLLGALALAVGGSRGR
jgi:hypothetical protein